MPPHMWHLPFSIRLQYGVGGMVEGVANNALPTFLLFYLTSVAGLPGTLAGAAVAIGTITDAVLDPLIGSATDNLHSRLGRRLPLMLAGLPVVVVCLALTFALPSGWPELALFAWVTMLSVALRTALSMFGIPYQAVAAEICEDYTERSVLIAWRWGGGLVAGAIVVVLGFSVFFAGSSGLSNRSAYPRFGLTIAVILLIAGLVASRVVYRTLQQQHPTARSGETGARHLRRELFEVIRNPSFRALSGMILLMLGAVAVSGSLAIHAGTMLWRLTPDQLQVVPLVLLAGLLVGTPFAAPLTKRLGKRGVAFAGLATLSLAYLVLPLLRVAGLLPLQGAALVALLATNAFIAGALVSSAAIAAGSMLADATDEHEYLFGARREGLYFAAWLFAGKAAAGLGTGLAGLILDFTGLPAHQSMHEGAVITAAPPDPHIAFALVYALVPGLLCLASIVALSQYRLTAEKQEEILAALRRRRDVA